MSLTVYFVNESTLMSATDAYKAAWACDYQCRFHIGRSGWRSDVRCSYVPSASAARIPAGSAILHLLDDADVQGALGYHDEDGNEVPFARVFVRTSQQVGDAVSEVCSHEVAELVVDPHVNLTALTGDMKRLYAYEVGDPVQGSPYPISGVQVANFALPAYFDPNTRSGRVDYRGVLSAPFTISPQGYMAYIDMANAAAGWQQTLGSERTSAPPPDADDRLGRRTSA